MTRQLRFERKIYFGNRKRKSVVAVYWIIDSVPLHLIHLLWRKMAFHSTVNLIHASSNDEPKKVSNFETLYDLTKSNRRKRPLWCNSCVAEIRSESIYLARCSTDTHGRKSKEGDGKDWKAGGHNFAHPGPGHRVSVTDRRYRYLQMQKE